MSPLPRAIRRTHLAILSLVVPISLAVLLTAGTARAASLGIQIVAQVDRGSGFVTQGTALGGPAGGSNPLLVLVSSGETVRFIVQYDQVVAYQAYMTLITADDPTEIDFIPGSAVDLSGKAFASFGNNPNNSLNDFTPGAGNGSSLGLTTVTGQDLYRVDYLVISPVDDFGPGPGFTSVRDFVINLTGVGTGNTINTAAREASASIVIWTPEPSSILLVGLGIAALALVQRRKGRGCR